MARSVVFSSEVAVLKDWSVVPVTHPTGLDELPCVPTTAPVDARRTSNQKQAVSPDAPAAKLKVKVPPVTVNPEGRGALSLKSR